MSRQDLQPDCLRHPIARRAWLGQVSAGALGLLLTGRAATWAKDRDADATAELFYHSRKPANAEPNPAALIESWITPVDKLYIRSHGNTPDLKAEDFQLSIAGLVDRPLTLGMAELAERFPQHGLTSTLTCAGNRREEFNAIKPVSGVQWRAGAIGNAHWSGTPLSALLKAAGLKAEAKHVWFEGADEVDHKGETIAFGGSIPIEKALSDTKAMDGALLASQMNDAPLTPDHGFPLRSIVPGYIGARSVKWLKRITVSDRPSPNHYLADAYKIIVDEDQEKLAAATPIYTYPLNCAICLLHEGGKPKGDKLVVAGYVLPTGKPNVETTKVEVSLDDGKTWTAAKLGAKKAAFCWQLWEAALPLTANVTQVIARATDSSGAVQPETAEWNLKGYLFNAWSHQKIGGAE